MALMMIQFFLEISITLYKLASWLMQSLTLCNGFEMIFLSTNVRDWNLINRYIILANF
jgi:hypothetical protein